MQTGRADFELSKRQDSEVPKEVAHSHLRDQPQKSVIFGSVGIESKPCKKKKTTKGHAVQRS